MYIYIHTCDKFFTKAQSLIKALTLQAPFLEWRLMRFGKELFISDKYFPKTQSLNMALALQAHFLEMCVHIYIYIHIYTHFQIFTLGYLLRVLLLNRRGCFFGNITWGQNVDMHTNFYCVWFNLR